MLDLEPWVPYKGNKAGILANLHQTFKKLAIEEPKGIVDAFCGGGSVSYYFASLGYDVVMNDVEKGLIDLHRLLATETALETLNEWKGYTYTKEQFNAIKNEDTALSAYVRSLWSFSNDGKTYLTSTENQDNKIEQYLRGEGEPPQRFKHIEDIALLHKRKKLNIDFKCGSYADLEIPEGWICYCDPPYAGTWQYKAGDFDHSQFYDWCLGQKGLVLISEYSMPDSFYLVDEYFKYNEGGGATKRKVAVEKVFSNKPLKVLTLF